MRLSPARLDSISYRTDVRCGCGAGVPSPVKNPQLVNMVIFRENCEDIYAGA